MFDPKHGALARTAVPPSRKRPFFEAFARRLTLAEGELWRV
jgi:hypothetical protein